MEQNSLLMLRIYLIDDDLRLSIKEADVAETVEKVEQPKWWTQLLVGAFLCFYYWAFSFYS